MYTTQLVQCNGMASSPLPACPPARGAGAHTEDRRWAVCSSPGEGIILVAPRCMLHALLLATAAAALLRALLGIPRDESSSAWLRM